MLPMYCIDISMPDTYNIFKGCHVFSNFFCYMVLLFMLLLQCNNNTTVRCDSKYEIGQSCAPKEENVKKKCDLFILLDGGTLRKNEERE